LVQSIQVRGQNAPIAEIAMGRPAANGPLHVTAVVPTNVAFPTVIRIAMEENDAHPLNLTWMRCLPGGCFADATPNEELIKRWRVHQEPGRIMFKDGANRDVTLPMSFQGLGPALDALSKEP
jgi:invasion protein IalB